MFKQRMSRFIAYGTAAFALLALTACSCHGEHSKAADATAVAPAPAHQALIAGADHGGLETHRGAYSEPVSATPDNTPLQSSGANALKGGEEHHSETHGKSVGDYIGYLHYLCPMCVITSGLIKLCSSSSDSSGGETSHASCH